MLTRRDLRNLLSGPFYLDGITRGYATSGTIGTSSVVPTLVDSSADGILDTAYDTDRFENSFLYIPLQSTPVNAIFTGSIAYNTGNNGLTLLTVTAVTSGAIAVGQFITGSGVLANTYVVAFVSGTGGPGTYIVAPTYSTPAVSTTMTSVGPYMGRVTEEEQRVLSYAPSTGTIEIGRPFAQAPTAGEYYELHTHGASAAAVNSAIKWACKNARTEGWFMLGGMIDDGEMQSESMSSWSIDTGVTAGKAVYSTEATTKRVMSIRGTTANPPTNGVWQTVPVQAGHTMQIFALVKSTFATDGNKAAIKIKNLQNIASPVESLEINPVWSGVTPIVYSTTNTNDDIYCSTTGDEEFWGGSFTVPAGCSSISVGMLGSGDWAGLALYDNVQQEVRWPGFLMPHDQFTLAVGYYSYYGHAAQEATTTLLRAPVRPEGPSWRIAPAMIPGALAVRAAVSIPYPTYDTDSYPPSLENYLVAGAFRYISQQLARPNTLDNVRFEGLRVKADKDWQAYSQSRNPMARSRMVWGRR